MPNYVERDQPGYHGVLSLQDALRMTVENVEFSEELRRNPEKYRSTFNLSDSAITALRNVTQEELLELRQMADGGTEGFSAAMTAAEDILKLHAGEAATEVYEA